MQGPRFQAERRKEVRDFRSEPVWWTCFGEARFRRGWLTDFSGSGAAFVTPGRLAPLPCTRVSITSLDPSGVAAFARGATVCRLEHKPSDLALVALQLDPVHL